MDTAAALTTLVLRVLVLKIGAWTVSARIRPVLIWLVLRNPVRIGSNELLMIPPFAILIPPFTLMVDAFRVEGIPATAWGNTKPFIDDTEILAELIVLVLIAGVITPPFRVARPVACIVVVALIGPLNVAPGACTIRPPTAVVCPAIVKPLPIVVLPCNIILPEFTARPPKDTDIPPATAREPFVIVWPPFTETVDSKMVEGREAGGG